MSTKTIEQKARAYDEALKKARFYHGNCPSEPERKKLEGMFPVLRESEDEKIRKELLAVINDLVLPDEQKARFNAWLEKQKEPHYTKRNALFDKCVENCDPEVMKKVSDEVDEMLEKEQKPNFDTHWENGSIVCEQKEQKPADLPAGFYVTLPDGKKYYAKEMRCNGMNVKVVEPKPAEWSEEDELMMKAVIGILDESDHPKLCSWLKSLRPQPKQEWSKEDENIYNKALDAIYYKDLNDKDEVVDALKALCDLISRKRKVIPPYAHWKPSEEQMEALKCAIADVARFSKRGGRQVELENEPYYSALHSLYCNLEKLI